MRVTYDACTGVWAGTEAAGAGGEAATDAGQADGSPTEDTGPGTYQLEERSADGGQRTLF